MTVTGSSIAVGPWAAIVEVYAVNYIIPTVGFSPTIVVAVLIQPRASSVNKEMTDGNQHKRAHLMRA